MKSLLIFVALFAATAVAADVTGTWKGGYTAVMTTPQGAKSDLSTQYTLVIQPDGRCQWTVTPHRGGDGGPYTCTWEMNGKHVNVHFKGVGYDSKDGELKVDKKELHAELVMKSSLFGTQRFDLDRIP